MTDQGEFVRLFMRHQSTLMAFVLSRGVDPVDAEDVVQEAATVLWRKFGSFRSGSDFRAWAFEIVRREVSRSRRLKAAAPLPLDPETAAAIDDTLLEEAPRLEAERRYLKRCIGKLTDALRRVVDLRYREDMKIPRIAETLSRPVGSIHVTLTRARGLLQECVQREARAAGTR